MVEHIPNLVPELQEQIFKKCLIDDLKHLSCCNSVYRDTIKGFLWQKVKIPWDYLLNFKVNADDNNRLDNLKWTRVLHFIVNVGWRCHGEYMTNYKHILSHCSPDLLSTLLIDRHIDVYSMPELPFCFEEIDIQCIKITVQLLPNLRRFTIMYMKVSEESLKAIGELSNLVELNVSDHSICDFKFSMICEKMKKLRLLNIEGNYCINNIGLIHIANLKSLQQLTLSKCNFNDLGLLHICSLITLKKLDLNRCHNITDNGIPNLIKLIHLKMLDVSHCFKVTDNGVHYISAMQCLQHVNFNYCMRLTDAGVLSLSRLVDLKCLKIASTGITDKGLLGISKLDFLRSLNLTRCRTLTDEGMACISKLVNLRKLNIGGTKVTDAAILHFHLIANLQELFISGCHFITDTGLFYLRDIIHLETLDISYTKVSVIGVRYLASIKSLRHLKCHHSIFSESIFLEFENLTLYCVDSNDEQFCRERIVFQ